MYIPADRHDDWVWMRGLDKPYESFGPESESAAQAAWASQLAKRGTPDYQENVRAPGGTFYGSPNVHLYELAALPRDPYRLLNYVYRTTLGHGPSPDGEALGVDGGYPPRWCRSGRSSAQPGTRLRP